jgi:outer membrane lipoprotein-sorting protein
MRLILYSVSGRATKQRRHSKVIMIRPPFWTVLLVLICSVIPPTGFAAASPLSLDDVLRQLDREQNEFQSLTASIERTKVTVVVNDRSTESGQIEVRRDGKMRIDLTSPDQKTILRDGDHIYIYTPKIRRVEEYDLAKHRDLVDRLLLLGFGTSGESLKRGYLITLQGEETLNGQRVVRLELTSRSDDVRKEISKIDLWLNEANWLPAQQQFYETGSGDYSIIQYLNVARNVPIADARFRAAWPKGVSRVKPQG